MQLFLDSARIDEVEFAVEHWNIDGVTTNPRHIAATERTQAAVLSDLARVVADLDIPVSVEVDPQLSGWREIADEGRRLADLSPNFVIKIAVSEEGCRAVRALAGQGLRTNVTLIFSAAQAWHASRSGATYVSPFIGWKQAHGDDGLQLISDVAQLLHIQNSPTRVLAAAIRNAEQIAAAALAGAHCITAGAAVIRESFQNPYTDLGVKLFAEAAARTRDSGPPPPA